MMKRNMKQLVILIFLLCYLSPAFAQQTIRNLSGTSASGRSLGTHDSDGNPIDTTAVTDAKTIPIGLYSWKVTRRLGNVIPTPVDTLYILLFASSTPYFFSKKARRILKATAGSVVVPDFEITFIQTFLCSQI